ncbi:hypothetical protein MVEN_00512000 [Mycena venus]|uniref:Uncharacterized protein n=1 Tax=Mycena venus TaxID=2733690 RepID=A0A8H6YPN7_9AGAR|nr:hypothetical protein MVEN_00512000 [Mycena venus]
MAAPEHSKDSEAKVKKVLRLACTQALASSTRAESSGSGSISALDLVDHAIASLEDSPLLNAGCGSNLTLAGTVECDAAIMDGNSADFGSVGAVSGIKNPIRLARLILEHARVPDPLGRIPPLTLVSSGAAEFTQFRNATDLFVPPESLVTPRASKTFPAVEDEDENGDGNDMEMQDLHALQDTVGAVALSITSNSTSGSDYSIASGVSSGGILLKHPGRIGEVQRVLAEEFWIPNRSPSNPDPSTGVVLLTTEEDGEGEMTARLWCAFTTPSMAIAYASPGNPLGKALILRRPKSVESRPNDQQRIFVTGIVL